MNIKYGGNTMANYTTSKGITFDMDQAAQRRRTNVDSRTGTNTSLYNKKNNFQAFCIFYFISSVLPYS